MKAVLALVFASVLASVGAFRHPQVVAVDDATKKAIAGALAKKLRATKFGSAEECSVCVTFMDQALDDLLQLILNGGVLGSCAALCGLLPNQLEAEVCNLLCDVVGVEAFVRLIKDADLDPIWMCEELTLCERTTCTKDCVAIKQLSPGGSTTFPGGAQVNWTVSFGIGSTGVGASTLAVTVTALSPNKDGNYLSTTEEAFLPQPTVGFFQTMVPTVLGDDNGNNGITPWPSGRYNSTATYCAGLCGSHHAGSGTVLAFLQGPTITIP